jgi:hypothetical protein
LEQYLWVSETIHISSNSNGLGHVFLKNPQKMGERSKTQFFFPLKPRQKVEFSIKKLNKK